MVADPWGGAYIYLYKGGDEIENFSIDDSPSGYPNSSTETIRGYIERTHGVVPYNVDSVVIQRWAGNIYTTYDALIASNFYENGDINIVLNVSGGIDEVEAQYIMDGNKKINIAPNIKVFNVSSMTSSSEIPTIDEAYQFIKNGGTSIIQVVDSTHYNNDTYICVAATNSSINFIQVQRWSSLQHEIIYSVTNGHVTSLTSDTSRGYQVLSPDRSYKIKVVTELPASPEANTLYFVKES